MSIDLAALIRRHKPERRLKPLPLRDPTGLSWFDNLRVKAGTRLLLDTGIYIKEAANQFTAEQSEKLARIQAHHCAACLGEIAVGLANRDVTDPRWPAECAYWSGLFAKLPGRRTYVPDAATWTAAGILAGTLTRTQGFQANQRKDVLNDASIYLTALKWGVPVLTENRRDFDWLQQLVPGGRFYLV